MKTRGGICGVRIRAVAVSCGLGATWRTWVLTPTALVRAGGPAFVYKEIRLWAPSVSPI